MQVAAIISHALDSTCALLQTPPKEEITLCLVFGSVAFVRFQPLLYWTVMNVVITYIPFLCCALLSSWEGGRGRFAVCKGD